MRPLWPRHDAIPTKPPASIDFPLNRRAVRRPEAGEAALSSLAEYRETTRRLAAGVERLAEAAGPLEVPRPAALEWYRTLTGKLLPQLGQNPVLVVAVVGGTNIGKSVVFNHICGEKVSRSAPTAAGTKHPTVAVPAGLADEGVLAAMFPGFTLRRWSEEGDPVRASEEDLLFWKVSQTVPENLVVLDTPDVDSTMRVNWERADKVRRSADLLVAVLTQQKYNDAVVVEFFAKAAAEGQVVAVVLNQLQLPEDEAYWPEYLTVFCQSTGIRPDLVYLAPLDRPAAERLELPFYQRQWSGEEAAAVDTHAANSSAVDIPAATIPAGEAEPHDLLTDLSALHFDAMKVHALRGALRQVACEVPDWLELLSQRAGELARSEQRAVAAGGREEWPTVPDSAVTRDVSQWWSAERTGFAAGVDAVYGTVGEVAWKAVRGLRSLAGNPPADEWQTYRAREWEDGIWPAVDRTFALIERLSDEGTPEVQRRAAERLEAVDRGQLKASLRQAFEGVDLPRLLDDVTNERLATFKTDAPEEYERLRKVRNAVVMARPALTVGGLLVGIPVVDFAAVPFVFDAAAGGALGGAAGGLAGLGVDKTLSLYDRTLREIPVEFARRRVEWLAAWLRQEFTGDLPDVLATAAAITEHAAYDEVRTAADDLQRQLAADASPDEDTPGGKKAGGKKAGGKKSDGKKAGGEKAENSNAAGSAQAASAGPA